MGILFADPGGEPYFSLGMPGGNVWTTNNSMTLVSNAPSGRRTTFAINGGGSGFGFERAIAGSPARIIAGAAVYIPAAWLNATDTTMISFKDAGTVQVDCRVTSTGAVRITRNGTSLALSSNVLTNGSGWHYFELDATINPSTGSATVWVDGVNWVSVSGANTRATSNSFAGTVRFYSGNSGQAASQWKDMYILDPSSGLYNAPLGDRDISVNYPSAAGISQQWTNTGGASQTVSVQDGRSGSGTRPDGDTSYISDSVSGHISDFAHDSLSAGAISAVIHMTYARSDAGTTTFNQLTRSNGTDRATAQSIGASYSYMYDIMETDPQLNFVLTSVATGSGVYTGTITGGGSNAYAGLTVIIAGFTTSANNGVFVCTASTTTTLTLSNSSSVSETHAATANGSWTLPNFNAATFGAGIP